jgi:hypothetical protein
LAADSLSSGQIFSLLRPWLPPPPPAAAAASSLLACATDGTTSVCSTLGPAMTDSGVSSCSSVAAPRLPPAVAGGPADADAAAAAAADLILKH